jgi:hypothetical protein
MRFAPQSHPTADDAPEQRRWHFDAKRLGGAIRLDVSVDQKPSWRQARFMSIMFSIVLQKSKVASVRIFGETLKRSDRRFVLPQSRYRSRL